MRRFRLRDMLCQLVVEEIPVTMGTGRQFGWLGFLLGSLPLLAGQGLLLLGGLIWVNNLWSPETWAKVNQVSVGMSKDQVERILFKPEITAFQNPSRLGIAEVWWYYLFASGTVLVYFNEEGKVVTTRCFLDAPPLHPFVHPVIPSRIFFFIPLGYMLFGWSGWKAKFLGKSEGVKLFIYISLSILCLILYFDLLFSLPVTPVLLWLGFFPVIGACLYLMAVILAVKIILAYAEEATIETGEAK